MLKGEYSKVVLNSRAYDYVNLPELHIKNKQGKLAFYLNNFLLAKKSSVILKGKAYSNTIKQGSDIISLMPSNGKVLLHTKDLNIAYNEIVVPNPQLKAVGDKIAVTHNGFAIIQSSIFIIQGQFGNFIVDGNNYIKVEAFEDELKATQQKRLSKLFLSQGLDGKGKTIKVEANSSWLNFGNITMQNFKYLVKPIAFQQIAALPNLSLPIENYGYSSAKALELNANGNSVVFSINDSLKEVDGLRLHLADKDLRFKSVDIQLNPNEPSAMYWHNNSLTIKNMEYSFGQDEKQTITTISQADITFKNNLTCVNLGPYSLYYYFKSFRKSLAIKTKNENLSFCIITDDRQYNIKNYINFYSGKLMLDKPFALLKYPFRSSLLSFEMLKQYDGNYNTSMTMNNNLGITSVAISWPYIDYISKTYLGLGRYLLEEKPYNNSINCFISFNNELHSYNSIEQYNASLELFAKDYNLTIPTKLNTTIRFLPFRYFNVSIPKALNITSDETN
jgi:hypothetical protein